MHGIDLSCPPNRRQPAHERQLDPAMAADHGVGADLHLPPAGDFLIGPEAREEDVREVASSQEPVKIPVSTGYWLLAPGYFDLYSSKSNRTSFSSGTTHSDVTAR